MMNRDSTKASRADRVSGRISGDEAKVSLSLFSFLFSEVCTRAHNIPTKAENIEVIERRLTQLGVIVGTKLIMLSSLKDSADSQRRPTTVDEVMKLLQEKFWTRWFGKAASDLQQENESDRYFLFDSNPIVLRHVFPSPEYMDAEGQWNINYASFMGGIVEGALKAIGFDAEVLTYHHPEPDKPKQSIFAVTFSEHVRDRENRVYE
uniref:Uncharacterized protein TCIL3000_9_5010 n=1 Tax=Trypanosoma congolense (strain IL3000) TaxID=1068625 RepID=G0UUN3_TRYCI|nr:unnamed protein product [Trypanosoma congolense IL3000]